MNEEADFNSILNDWVEKCQKVMDEYYEKTYPTLNKPKLEIEINTKLVKVFTVNRGSNDYLSRHVYAFVAKEDYSTKVLGQVKKGDILKPAPWKAPVKHARGNLYDSDGGMKYIGAHGPAYLK